MSNKQIQARNNLEWIRVNIDQDARHNIDRIHKVVRELLNVRISDSVLIRRALMVYRMYLIEQMAAGYSKANDAEGRMEAVTKLCEDERLRLNQAAELGFFGNDKE